MHRYIHLLGASFTLSSLEPRSHEKIEYFHGLALMKYSSLQGEMYLSDQITHL